MKVKDLIARLEDYGIDQNAPVCVYDPDSGEFLPVNSFVFTHRHGVDNIDLCSGD